jgi:putative tryptophan/tyrosine transport system substrate-binding protein
MSQPRLPNGSNDPEVLLALIELGRVGRNRGQTYQQNERAADMSPELMHAQVELLVGGGRVAAQGATATLPVVFVGVNDPVAQGVVASPAQPGGTVTGLNLAR